MDARRDASRSRHVSSRVHRTCRLGTGDIIEKCRDRGLPAPIWENEDDGFTVTLRRKLTTVETSPETSPETSLETSSEKFLNGLSKGARQVVALIKSDDKITTQSMADRINVSKRMVMNYVKELASVGLRHEGPTKKGRWVFDVVATKNDASKAKNGKAAK